MSIADARAPPNPSVKLSTMTNTHIESSAAVTRRIIVLTPVAFASSGALGSDDARESGKRWIDAAEEMKKQALSWGDQAYGAVLVKDNRIIGYGPSRVVKNKDPDAHAEREAIKHALSELGPQAVAGSILYSTSRPCRACELAAAKAGVQRMYFGQTAQDGGLPKGG